MSVGSFITFLHLLYHDDLDAILDIEQDTSEVLPEILGTELAAELLKRKPGQRGAQKRPKKESVTVRYSLHVLDYFRSTGPGWQTRMDAALKDWVAQHRQGSKR
jgi:uncharacterized protein (DUF4415 family)